MGKGTKRVRSGRRAQHFGERQWGSGAQMFPPPFGTPDAVDEQEDEDYEQEPHHGGQARQPRLQAILRGCWKRRGGTQR